MSFVKHGHGSGGLDIPGLGRDYLCIIVEPCCVKMFVVYCCRFQWNGFPWTFVGHVYGIVHVSLLMVWKITRRFWFC